MKKFAIFGNPVEHSKSPQMHNAGFKHIKFDAIYIKHKLEDSKNIKEVFLKNNYSGVNITVPHKEVAYLNAHKVFGLANKIKAVNTYKLTNGQIEAYNTDAPGFIKAIEEFKSINNVLVLGSGGTSKAICIALQEKDVKVDILNRSNNNLNFFQDNNINFYTLNNFKIQNYDLIVNSTSAGLKDELLPAPKEILEPLLQNSHYAFDCIYGKETSFLSLAKKNNCRIKDGEDMLLYQGVLAFELFTNVKADKLLIEAMRLGLKINK